jgi:hypothetical protein
MMDIDSIALEAARNVMNELLANSYPKGGNVQLQAIIQCKISDVLRQQLAEQTSSCSTCGETEPYTGNCGTSDSDTKALCKRQPPSVEVLLEALRKIQGLTGCSNAEQLEAMRNIYSVCKNALNAYSAKPQKHLDN